MIKRSCDNCGNEYMADERNLKRGWGKCCSKSCAASLREKSKPGYNPDRVAINNIRRENWNDSILDKMFGDKSFVDKIDNGRFRGRTSEGYRIFGETVYDEWGEPIYSIDGNDDEGDSEYWDSKDFSL